MNSSSRSSSSPRTAVTVAVLVLLLAVGAGQLVLFALTGQLMMLVLGLVSIAAATRHLVGHRRAVRAAA